MGSDDMDLRSGVRNALTRHWFDLQKTNYFVRRGHVQLTGEASVIGAQRKREDTAEALKAFETDIRRLPEFKSMTCEFTNWVRDESGEWTSASRAPTSDPGSTSGGSQQGNSKEAG